jgi:hypothetical protein
MSKTLKRKVNQSMSRGTLKLGGVKLCRDHQDEATEVYPVMVPPTSTVILGSNEKVEKLLLTYYL